MDCPLLQQLESRWLIRLRSDLAVLRFPYALSTSLLMRSDVAGCPSGSRAVSVKACSRKIQLERNVQTLARSRIGSRRSGNRNGAPRSDNYVSAGAL